MPGPKSGRHWTVLAASPTSAYCALPRRAGLGLRTDGLPQGTRFAPSMHQPRVIGGQLTPSFHTIKLYGSSTAWGSHLLSQRAKKCSYPQMNYIMLLFMLPHSTTCENSGKCIEILLFYYLVSTSREVNRQYWVFNLGVDLNALQLCTLFNKPVMSTPFEDNVVNLASSISHFTISSTLNNLVPVSMAITPIT